MTWTTSIEQRDAPWDVSVSLSDRTATVSIGGRMFRFVMNHEQLSLFVADLTKAEAALGGPVLREQGEEQDRAAD